MSPAFNRIQLVVTLIDLRDAAPFSSERLDDGTLLPAKRVAFVDDASVAVYKREHSTPALQSRW